MLTPAYLTKVPDRMVDLYAQVEADILADMARRINGYDMFIPAAQHQLRMLEEMGGLREDTIAQLSKVSGKSQAELLTILQEAGVETLRRDDAIYRAVGLTPAPLTASMPMQQALQAGLAKTNGLFDNLTKTTARTATKQFERALDRAYMQVSSGAFSPDVAVKNAIKDLCAQGVEVIRYPTGHVDTMEVAVRRATLTGINQTTGKLQELRMDEMGCDLVEVTAHGGARPEHAKWQGGIFSRSGKSKKYPSLVEVTGYGTGPGLMGWNCSHSFKPYFEGMPRTYSKELLKDYEGETVEYNGQKMTQYDALQRQRDIERHIRRWKREKNTFAAVGGDTSQANKKLRQWNATRNDFLEQTGLKRQAGREFVAKS